MSLRLLTCVAAAASMAPCMVAAQSADERDVLAAIHRTFEGMRTADSALVRAQFAPGARFASVRARGGAPASISYDTVGGWINAIASSNRRWDEQIYDVQVRVDGNIAQAWTPYTFYLDKAVRHCGVNMIALLKDATGWKITELSDTQRREHCPDPLARPAGTDATVALPLDPMSHAGKAHIASLKTFLRNLVVSEEQYFSNNQRYTMDVKALGLRVPPDFTIVAHQLNTTGHGWSAILTSRLLPGMRCGIGVNARNPVDAAVGEGDPICK